MKIDGPNITDLKKVFEEKRVERAKKGAERVQQGEEQTNLSGDSVNLSPEATWVNELKSMIKGIPDIREDRIDSIKKEITDNTYQTDNEQVAHAIIRDNILNHIL